MPDPAPSESVPAPEPEPAPSPPVLLRLEDFSFQYRGAETRALAGIDLVLRGGDAVAVLGPQGAGTSTLARAAAGLLGEHGHSTGVRELPGDDTHGSSTGTGGEHDHRGVGMLGDDPEAQLTGLTRTVRDEAALPGRLSGLPLTECLERAEASLQALGIAGLAERPLATLSGGERQLTALAGLLTLRPSVLVLDQPSQALDASARRRLTRSLRAFRDAGGAVLLTGHQHNDLTAACGQVLFLDQGRPATAGPEGLSAEGLGVERADQAQLDELQLDDARLDQHGIWDARRTPTRGEQSSSGAPERNREVLLSVRELSVRRESTRVLENLALDLHTGEVTALLGANGSGKSTLLSALAGLIPAEPGARITGPGGVELAVAPAHHRAGHLAWVGQDPGDQLSASTVRAELMRAVPLGPGGRRLRREDRATARALREEQVREVMELAGLSAVAEEHPYDLVPAQRKDCVIASALLLTPTVLLLDEPTLGRDAVGMNRLSALVRGFTAAGGAVLVATHDQRWAAGISDRQLRLGAEQS